MISTKARYFFEILLQNFPIWCLGQARLDGAFCSYTKEDKLDYLQRLNEGGVSNIEMESTCFAALTYMAGIRSAVVCVALLDRLNEDQVCFENHPGFCSGFND